MARLFSTQQNPSFTAFNGDLANGFQQLDSVLTINGIPVTASFVYKGQDATTTEWSGSNGIGEPLELTSLGATNPTINQGVPLVNSIDKSVRFNGGEFYAATISGSGEVTTEDLFFECVISFNSTSFGRIADAREPGWSLFQNDNDTITLSLHDIDTNSIFRSTATLFSGNTWYHVMVFVNRDENSSDGLHWYVNGEFDNNGNAFFTGSLAGGVPVRLGASHLTFNRSEGYIGHVAMWQQNSWHQAGVGSHDEWSAIAKERFSKLTGIYAQHAEGVAVPMSMFRNSHAHLDIFTNGTGSLYSVGNNWSRIVRRTDVSGNIIVGLLVEDDATNLISYSSDLTNYGKSNVYTSLSDVSPISSPFPGLSASILGEQADTLHILSTPAVSLTSGSTYTYSVWAKAINRNWLLLRESNSGKAAYFDVSTGLTGTRTAQEDIFSSMEDWADGWYRCKMTFQAETTGDVIQQLYLAEADGDVLYPGLNQDALALFGFQHETSTNAIGASSYIHTSGATATREVDKIQYSSSLNVSSEKGYFEYDLLALPEDVTTNSNIFSLRGATAGANNVIYHTFAQAGFDEIRINQYSGSDLNVNYNGSISLTDEKIHHIKHSWETNRVRTFNDTILEGSDFSASMPEEFTYMELGEGWTQGGRYIISNLKIYKQPFPYASGSN